MSVSATKLVFGPDGDACWAPVFALRPDLDRIELESWDAGDGPEGDLTVFYRDSPEPFPIRSLREGVLKDALYECWARVSPELFG